MSKIKKVVLIVVGIIIGIFLLVVINRKTQIFSFNDKNLDIKKVNKLEGVALSLDTEIYSNDNESIIGTIQNKTEERYTTGDKYYLEYLEDDSWIEISPKVNASEDLLYILEPNSEIKREYNINEKYFSLKSGMYRIVEDISDVEGEQFLITAKFEIK